MKRADPKTGQTGGAGFGDCQVGLTPGDARGGASLPRALPSPRYRLKRSVDLFTASDGTLYLLRLGAGDDLEITDADHAHRALLERLAADFASQQELELVLGNLGLAAECVGQDLADLGDADVLETQTRRHLLAPEEAERYDRQLIYFADLVGAGVSPEALQLRLGDAEVVLLGCGGLGSWVASGLSCAGVGSLVLIDDDRVELSNLNRQLLFAERQLGELKVDAAAEALLAHNSSLSVNPIRRRVRCVDDLDDVLARGPQLLVATADWPPHELPRWVNQACIDADVPWIGAGQFPPRLRVGPMVIPGRSACLECLELATRRKHPLYGQVARWRSGRETPDASVGPVTGAVGSLLAAEALHLLLGAFQPASVGHALLLDLQTMELNREPVARDPGCSQCARHPVARATRTPAPDGLGAMPCH